LTLNKPSYLVGELINFSLTGAPPNSPIYWTSWQDGALRNNNAFYGHYTDQFGNWSTLSDLPKPEYVGAWQGYITVGFSIYSFGFSVKPKPLSSENYFAQTVSAYRWEQLGYANGAKLIGDLGSRTLHLLFDAPGCNPSTPGCNVNANPFIALAQTADISKEFGDSRFNTYVLTMFGGRAARDVAYLTSGGQPLTKYFWSPDLFNPAISPIPNYRDRIISEISEFAQYLIQTYRGTGKKFILSNWETDNVIRCGEVVSYAEVDQAATRRPPMKICNGISTPTAGEIIPYTSNCSGGSPGVLAKGCAVGQHPNEAALYVRQNESCPGGTSYSVTPLSLGANGGWIPQDPNDPDHNPQWSYPFRTWCDGSVGPVSFNLKKYDGSPGLPDDSVDGFRRIFEAKQEGVRQGRESAAAQG
jgi:hypothetical protein